MELGIHIGFLHNAGARHQTDAEPPRRVLMSIKCDVRSSVICTDNHQPSSHCRLSVIVHQSSVIGHQGSDSIMLTHLQVNSVGCCPSCHLFLLQNGTLSVVDNGRVMKETQGIITLRSGGAAIIVVDARGTACWCASLVAVCRQQASSHRSSPSL